MDDLKFKLLGLIQKQGHVKIPIVGSDSSFIEDDHESQNTSGDPKTAEPDRPSDQEILESIDRHYYQDVDFDPARYELEKFAGLDIEIVEKELEKLDQQHCVVSSQVLQMILEKQVGCKNEFNRVVDIQQQVDELINFVHKARSNLGIATRHFTTASLGILSNYRKRTVLTQLLRSLGTIGTLRLTESRVEELLNEEDYAGAISLVLEGQAVANTYKHFNCVAALASKLQDTLDLTEQHLDVSLAKMCTEFDEDVYYKLQTAYSLLGKTQLAMDQLHLHFTTSVQNSALEAVCMFVPESQLSPRGQYAQVCKCVPEETFIKCLIQLSKSMWAILLSYYKIRSWHRSNDSLLFKDVPDSSRIESGITCQYIKEKLETGVARVWQDVQNRVSSLVLAVDLTSFKYDDLLQVLGVLQRLSEIGEELCGKGSEELANSVRTQSSNYFKTYHSSRMDDLKTFFENEAWTPCPVRNDFSLLHLQEFRGLRGVLEHCAGLPQLNATSIDSSSSIGAGYFTKFWSVSPSPFDTSFEIDLRQEEILSQLPGNDTGFISEESDDEEHHSNSKGPLLTNTTLTVLRHCGKYLQMSKLLKAIVPDVVAALCQLFEYYLYTVHTFFTADSPLSSFSKMSSIKLQAVLKRIKDVVIREDGNEETYNRVGESQMSPMVDLHSKDNLYGLSERIVAVESLIFLSQQFNLLRPYLEQLLQAQGSSIHSLSQFYSQTIGVAVEVRRPVYGCVAWKTIDSRLILNMMSRVDWEVKDVMSQHSSYVDSILQELETFKVKLDALKATVAIPPQVIDTLWDNIALLSAYIFVEGFSSSKKCSPGGRALMQLDYTQFILKLEKLSKLKPVPHKDYVEMYIKAFYKPEQELEAWIKETNDYSSKHLIALVSSACVDNKKTKQRLITVIEDIDRSASR